MDKIAVLDFGAQYTQLIARRIRELGVYSEILPLHRSRSSDVLAAGYQGIVLSGRPVQRLRRRGARCPTSALLRGGHPAARHLLRHAGHGLSPGRARRAGRAPRVRTGRGRPRGARSGSSRASHPDTSTGLHHGLDEPRRHRAAAAAGVPLAGHHRQLPGRRDGRRRSGGSTPSSSTPRSRTRPRGKTRPRELPLPACGAQAGLVDELLRRPGRRRRPRGRSARERVLCALSGGVDSSVVAALVHRAIGDQLTCLFVDNGLLRKGEAEAVRADLPGRDSRCNLIHVDAAARFLERLRGVTDPERSASASAPSSSPSSRRRRERLGDDPVARPGHALSRRDRIRVVPGARRRRSRPTTTSAGCRRTCASSWSSRCASCSRTRCASSASSSGCRRRSSGASRSRVRGSPSASWAR